MKRRLSGPDRYRAALLLLCLTLTLSACAGSSGGLQDGYYTAEAAEFDEYGWKEFLTIYVSGGKIVTVEYDAKNASGFVKSWDMDYMRAMRETDGTYPNEYVRIYTESLLNRQDPDKVDAVSGATDSFEIFQLLARAAVAQSTAGDKSVAFIELRR